MLGPIQMGISDLNRGPIDCPRGDAHAKGIVFSERRVSAFYDLLKPPLCEPLLRTLLKTACCAKFHKKAPSKNPS